MGDVWSEINVTLTDGAATTGPLALTNPVASGLISVPVNNQQGSPYLSSVGGNSISSPFATVLLGSGSLLQGGSVLFSVSSVAIVISNQTSTNPTIIAAQLQFTDTIGGLTSTISYTLPNVSIAASATQSFVVNLSSGYLKNAQVAITYSTIPSIGSFTVQALFSANTVGSSTTASTTVGSADPITQVVQTASVKNIDGESSQLVFDRMSYRLLEYIFLELQKSNVLLNKLASGPGSAD